MHSVNCVEEFHPEFQVSRSYKLLTLLSINSDRRLLYGLPVYQSRFVIIKQRNLELRNVVTKFAQNRRGKLIFKYFTVLNGAQIFYCTMKCSEIKINTCTMVQKPHKQCFAPGREIIGDLDTSNTTFIVGRSMITRVCGSIYVRANYQTCFSGLLQHC